MMYGDYLLETDPVKFKKWTRKHYMIYWYSKNRLNKTNKNYKYDKKEHDDYLEWCLLNPRTYGTRGKQRIGYIDKMIEKHGEVKAKNLMSSNHIYRGSNNPNIPNLKKEIKTIKITFD